MDLYGTSGQAISNGNMRSNSVRDLNAKIREHNKSVTTQIQGLKEQTQTAESINEALNTGKTLWAGSKMPGAVKEYQKYKAKQNQGKVTQSNPESETNSTLRQSATENDPLRQAMGENQLRDMAGVPVERLWVKKRINLVVQMGKFKILWKTYLKMV